jgi:hypothetical protein
MPRGNPKRHTDLRLDPATIDAVRAYGVPLTQAVEEGLALWLGRQKRKVGKAEADRIAARKARHG